MSIRNPIDLAAAAITAGSAVDSRADQPARAPLFASAPVFAFTGTADAIRAALLPETAPAAPAKKGIPGQTYH